MRTPQTPPNFKSRKIWGGGGVNFVQKFRLSSPNNTFDQQAKFHCINFYFLLKKSRYFLNVMQVPRGNGNNGTTGSEMKGREIQKRETNRVG